MADYIILYDTLKSRHGQRVLPFAGRFNGLHTCNLNCNPARELYQDGAVIGIYQDRLAADLAVRAAIAEAAE